jgi:peptidoglycan hydrolase-like protein with peptidoglycan-binding domain
MTRHREPGPGELAVRPDDTAPVPSADGEQALVAAPEQAAQQPPNRPTGPPAGRPRRRRALVAGVLVLMLGGAGAGGYALVADRSSSSSATTAAKAVTTAVVSRANLVDTEQDDGSLGYDDQQTLHSGVRGVLTALPDEGATVSRGRSLYRVDNQPVTLLYGTLPLYRTLAAGVDDGPDVTQLERNLDALGYGDNLTVDDHFSSATTDAVKAWQTDRGLKETGRVDATQVVFVGHAVRVGKHKAAVGDQVNAGAPVTDISSTTRVATVDLAADSASIAHVGDKVDIELPSGRTVKGTISEVGKVATTASSTSSGSTAGGSTSSSSNSSSEATITVDIRVDQPRQTGDLDQTPVKVVFVKERKRGVLAVPVTALVALAEGGYAVEVSDGTTTHLAKVRTGLFAGGQVEVTGAGLRQGQRVVVPE